MAPLLSILYRRYTLPIFPFAKKWWLCACFDVAVLLNLLLLYTNVCLMIICRIYWNSCWNFLLVLYAHFLRVIYWFPSGVTNLLLFIWLVKISLVLHALNKTLFQGFLHQQNTSQLNNSKKDSVISDIFANAS